MNNRGKRAKMSQAQRSRGLVSVPDITDGSRIFEYSVIGGQKNKYRLYQGNNTSEWLMCELRLIIPRRARWKEAIN